jgi:hypothetical protein
LANALAQRAIARPTNDKTGHTWHDTDDALIGITKLGLKPFAGDDYESDMPTFGAILSDEELGTCGHC